MRRIDDEFAEFDQPDVPGLALMVIENGVASIVRSFGLANIEQGVLCQPHTNFRLASVTKQFTAMAILILAERGELSLEDHLPRFFPNFPSYGNAMTISQLLTHTSGLLDYEDLIPPGTRASLKDRDVLDIFRSQDKTYFPPGARFRYSNGGYALLALIAETVSGRGFAGFLRENIFRPLGMDGTVAYEAGLSEVPHRALGYARRGATFEPADQSLTSSVLGDGGIYSSVLDLFKWDQALSTGKLIRPQLLRQAFAAHSSLSDFPGSGYGFGWYVEGHGEHQRLWHYGATCGFSASFHRFPARKWSVILLANRSEAGLEDIARKIAR